MSEEDSKKSSMGMIIGLIIIGLLLAGGISYFIATKIASSNPSNSKKEIHEPGIMMKLGDSKDGLVINIGGLNSGRYLKVSLVLDIVPNKNDVAKDKKGISSDEAKILDSVVHVLRSQKVGDFEPSKQERLKVLLSEEINKALGEKRVNEVYITNFVLQ